MDDKVESKDALLKGSMTFTIHSNGDITVETGTRKVRLKRSLSSSNSFEPVEPAEPEQQKDEMEDVYKKCRTMADEWYNKEYNVRMYTAYDSKYIDGELYLGRRSAEELQKERDEYYQKLLDEHSHRIPSKPAEKKSKVDDKDRQKTCFGCIYDKPGQDDHMGDGGCLASSSKGSASLSSLSL